LIVNQLMKVRNTEGKMKCKIILKIHLLKKSFFVKHRSVKLSSL